MTRYMIGIRMMTKFYSRVAVVKINTFFKFLLQGLKNKQLKLSLIENVQEQTEKL